MGSEKGGRQLARRGTDLDAALRDETIRWLMAII